MYSGPVRVGHHYVVREWDGTQSWVRVLRRPLGEVIFQYEDGLTHKTTRDYFKGLVVFAGGPSPAKVPMFSGRGPFGNY